VSHLLAGLANPPLGGQPGTVVSTPISRRIFKKKPKNFIFYIKISL